MRQKELRTVLKVDQKRIRALSSITYFIVAIYAWKAFGNYPITRLQDAHRP